MKARRTSAQMDAIRSRIRDLVLADHPLKYAVQVVDLSLGRVAFIAWQLGFRRMYVTNEERAHLLKRRAA